VWFRNHHENRKNLQLENMLGHLWVVDKHIDKFAAGVVDTGTGVNLLPVR
jgi:hypothetical protein